MRNFQSPFSALDIRLQEKMCITVAEDRYGAVGEDVKLAAVLQFFFTSLPGKIKLQQALLFGEKKKRRRRGVKKISAKKFLLILRAKLLLPWRAVLLFYSTHHRVFLFSNFRSRPPKRPTRFIAGREGKLAAVCVHPDYVRYTRVICLCRKSFPGEEISR